MPVSTNALRLADMASLKATGEPLAGPTLILFSTPLAPTPDMLIGDLTECTFTGYAAVPAIAFGAPFYDILGAAMMAAPSVQFESTAATPSEVIHGWAIVNAAKTVLWYAEQLNQPVPISGPSQGVIIQPVVPYGV